MNFSNYKSFQANITIFECWAYWTTVAWEGSQTLPLKTNFPNKLGRRLFVGNNMDPPNDELGGEIELLHLSSRFTQF